MIHADIPKMLKQISSKSRQVQQKRKKRAEVTGSNKKI